MKFDDRHADHNSNDCRNWPDSYGLYAALHWQSKVPVSSLTTFY